MRPRPLALLFFIHALGHAGAGMWAAGQASPWIVTPLWILSMGGFLATAIALLGVERLQGMTTGATWVATIASAVMLRLAHAGWLALAGLGIGVGLAALLQWWVRCAHPEIHTPTVFTSGEVKAVVEQPSRLGSAGYAVMFTFLAYTVLLILLRPWFMTWGSTSEERAERVPGYEAATDYRYRIDHGVKIRAPAEHVWPWIAQLGQDRGGFYSYEWLERAFGDRIHNADSIVPAWQQRRVGELLRAAQPDYFGGRFGSDVGWRITAWDPPRLLFLEDWGAFQVRAIDDSTARFTVQTRGPGTPSFASLAWAPIGFYALEPAHFVMERAMLRGVQERAERGVGRSSR